MVVQTIEFSLHTYSNVVYRGAEQA